MDVGHRSRLHRTFAASIVLVAGVADPAVLVLLGNVKQFLLVAGLAGAVPSLHDLFVAA